jgi:hypothetical protein
MAYGGRGATLWVMRRRSRLDDAVINVLALAWVGRGLWRISHGRVPWRAR